MYGVLLICDYMKYNKRITIAVDKGTYDCIHAIAKQKRITVSALIRDYVLVGLGVSNAR